MSVHNEYTGYTLKHLLLRPIYNLPLPILLCYAQALRSETSYCYYGYLSSAVTALSFSLSHTVLCGALYTACVDASRTVFWDHSPELHGKACQMPSGKFHYFLLMLFIDNLNADASARAS